MPPPCLSALRLLSEGALCFALAPAAAAVAPCAPAALEFALTIGPDAKPGAPVAHTPTLECAFTLAPDEWPAEDGVKFFTSGLKRSARTKR